MFSNDERTEMSQDTKPQIWTRIETPRCSWCGYKGELEVPMSGLVARNQGALIQDAFPEMSRPEREQIVSGTHPECWEKMFGGFDA